MLILLLGYVSFAAVWAGREADRHACRGISVSIRGGGISDSITQKGVLELLRKYPEKIVGMPLNRVNTLGIEKYIMGMNNFEEVSCYLTSKGYLAVSIQPMVPEIRVFDGNESYYVNKDGKKISSKAEFFVDVPVVSGRFSRNFSPKDILPVIRYVEKDSILRNLVVMYSAKGPDDIILVPRITGHVINFGDTTRLDEKRTALLTAYHNIIPYTGWDKYDTISVKFRGQIVATRRNKTPLYKMEEYIEEIDPEEAALPTEEHE